MSPTADSVTSQQCTGDEKPQAQVQKGRFFILLFHLRVDFYFINTPQPLKAAQVLFLPMVSGWVFGWADYHKDILIAATVYYTYLLPYCAISIDSDT